MNNNNKKWCFTTGIILGEVVYLVCRDYAMLVAMDFNSGECIWIKKVPDEDFDTLYGSWRIIPIEDKLVIVPFNFRYIHIYDITNGKWDMVDFGGSKKNANQYSEALVHENRVIMLGALVDNIILLDTDNSKTKVINSYFKELDSRRYYNCRGGYVHIDDDIYIPISCKCEVLKLNLSGYEYEVINISDKLPGFSGIAYDGENFWLPSRINSSVGVYNKEFCEIDRVDLSSTNSEEESRLEGAYYYQDYIYIHGQYGKDTYIIDRDTKEVTKREAMLQFLYGTNDFLIGQYNDRSLLLKLKDKEKKLYPRINDDIKKVFFEIVKQETLCCNLLKETEELVLRDFLNLI